MWLFVTGYPSSLISGRIIHSFWSGIRPDNVFCSRISGYQFGWLSDKICKLGLFYGSKTFTTTGKRSVLQFKILNLYCVGVQNVLIPSASRCLFSFLFFKQVTKKWLTHYHSCALILTILVVIFTWSLCEKKNHDYIKY